MDFLFGHYRRPGTATEDVCDEGGGTREKLSVPPRPTLIPQTLQQEQHIDLANLPSPATRADPAQDATPLGQFSHLNLNWTSALSDRSKKRDCLQLI